MGLFDRFKTIREVHGAVKACGADPFGVKMERIVSATEAVIEGRPTILCGSNNYLGLTFDADCVAAAQRATAEFGTGTTGSRIANGSYSCHKALEQDLADFYGKRHCMVFTTGYQANLGAMSTLVGPCAPIRMVCSISALRDGPVTRLRVRGIASPYCAFSFAHTSS